MHKLDKRRCRPESETWKYWKVMTFAERFEHLVALTLSFVIGVIIAIALWGLIREVYLLLVLGALDPLDYRVFQTIFGMIMTLLIAMEFKHSILKVLDRSSHIVQVKIVILIAQLALARKFIILDFETTSAGKIAALGFAVLVLGLVFFLLNQPLRLLGERFGRQSRTTSDHQ